MDKIDFRISERQKKYFHVERKFTYKKLIHQRFLCDDIYETVTEWHAIDKYGFRPTYRDYISTFTFPRKSFKSLKKARKFIKNLCKKQDIKYHNPI